MKIIREPSVYLVGRQTIHEADLERFLSDHEVESWQTDTDVAGQKLSEVEIEQARLGALPPPVQGKENTE